MYYLNPIQLYEFLESKNIHHFHHANSVRTACTFIENKGLFSRGSIERRGLVQTTQSSDAIDKEFDVWNDIFLDIVDLHGYFPRQNYYGPVCFVLDTKLLLDDKLPNICITKDNPIYWNEEMSDEEKYYSSVDEYINNFDIILKEHRLHSQMFTIHNIDGRIPLKKYLIKIILDNPRLKIGEIKLLEKSKQKLVESLNDSGISDEILEIRKCQNCFCKDNYFNQVEVSELVKLFL